MSDLNEMQEPGAMALSDGPSISYGDLVEDDRVHRRLYTDEAIFAAEMQRLFGSVWVYLAHTSQLPGPGDFVTTRMGRRPLIVCRGEDGEVNALFNRCAHRGVMLCMEDRGSAKRFTCPYHGWSFGSDGRLLGMPLPQGYPESFDRSQNGLGVVPRLEIYRGLIFGTLNRAAATLSDWLGPASEYLDAFIDRVPGSELDLSHGGVSWEYPGNWKLLWDNNADGYHVNWTHRSLQHMTTERHGEDRTLTHFERKTDDGGIYVADLGNGHKLVDQRGGMGSRWKRQRPVPGREVEVERIRAKAGEDADVYLEAAAYGGINLSIFPNVMISLNDIAVNEPVTVRRSIVHRYTSVPADASPELERLRLRIGEDMPSFGSPDDVEMFARQQRGLEDSPEVEWLDMSRGLDRESLDERGIRIGRATDDTGMRGGFAEWSRRMSAPVELSVA